MKKLILAATLGATMMTVSTPVLADPPAWAQANGRRDRDYREDRREARKDAWRDYRRYDYNRPQQGQRRYYAENYYRDGRYYQPVRLWRNDRIYRGNDGRYYCRRSDGTTGLIVGAAVGGLIGNSLGRGDSSVLATLLGAGAGAALGSSIDRGNVTCR
ncbi:MAG: glycine zipper 2TM domain-containing protein [Sphingomonadales bacterium]